MARVLQIGPRKTTTDDHCPNPRRMERQSLDKKVLIVDDDDDCRRIYTAALEHAGYSVLTANDGAEGVRMARSHGPSVILLDIAMPVLDGLAALKQLRADPVTRTVPTLALSASASVHHATNLLAAGFDELLLKPIRPFEVVDAVARHAGEA